MKCTILHETRGRMRVHTMQGAMSLQQADILEAYLNRVSGVTKATVYDRTGDAVICYDGPRETVTKALSSFAYAKEQALAPEHSSRALNRDFEDKLVASLCWRGIKQLFVPSSVRTLITVARSVPYIKAGMTCLMHRKIQVPVLDATAITVSMLRKDFKTASSIMFLLGIGDILDEWTHKKSVADLAQTMSLNVDKVWKETDVGSVLVPVADVQVGDRIVIHTGNVIPLDGKVVSGEAMVNQASITGEPLAVRKAEGGYVYAGTVVEEGDCTICVEKSAGSGRYDRIIRMIEESEKLKSATEDHASHLADQLVPYSLGATALVWLLTGNMTKALAVLMVDFSCALKLSMPIAVLSAMKEASDYHLSVKGGRFLEAVSDASTIVFDKTGTLTRAEPKVAQIVTFDGNDEADMLRLAACLEEHYPHSMAKAVVAEAARRGLRHEERHSHVEYLVAHGISSSVDGQKVVIGSHHFVFEDEKCTIPTAEQQKFDALKPAYSHLYMAASGQLVGVICISDPLRPEAAAVLNGLRALGIRNTVMMTGDSERTAAAIAKQVGVDQFFAEVLPEDKANFVQKAKAEGHTVVMIGDGINDSPALSAADIGIAINSGAAIAREIADVTIKADSLEELVILKTIANSLQRRVSANYHFVLTFNSALIALGAMGILQPASSAMLHNLSTIGISLKSMTNLIPEEKAQKALAEKN